MARFMSRLILTAILWAALGAPLPAAAEAPPAWWAQAQSHAKADGYALMSAAELRDLLKKTQGTPGKALLLDVRPAYEHQAGHIDHAASLEFHLGHRLALDQATKEAFLKLVGPDRERPIIIYCRSFR